MGDLTKNVQVDFDLELESVPMRSDLHVVPTFEEHDTSSDCRCQPKKEHTDEDTGVSVWVHRVLN